MKNQSYKQLLDELKTEHEVIIRCLDNIQVEQHDSNRCVDVDDFKKYLLRHLLKEDARLYSEYYKRARDSDQINMLNKYIKEFVKLSDTSISIIESGDAERVRELAETIKQRIAWEEKTLFKMFEVVSDV